tara:strand:- start:1721 stop:1918 length:198 start_codon:yes stop_codon:yes gene_type:complete
MDIEYKGKKITILKEFKVFMIFIQFVLGLLVGLVIATPIAIIGLVTRVCFKIINKLIIRRLQWII